MTQIIILYLTTVVVFLGIDFFGLTYLLRPLFERHISDLLTESFRFGPALVFYLFYIGGLLVFVSWPALKADAPGQALLMGMLLGALAYGTYEFTNYATIKAWHWHMVAVDLVWGSLLTGVAAWAGVSITRALS
ncbi:DUF2177 family protein [Primorskyibacter sp. S187A]|uniref:DUF2177 family protein n=1 Tax=Primorskyibacter sp. S187A TaxID=3415130 RepID=UPI003C7EBB7E